MVALLYAAVSIAAGILIMLTATGRLSLVGAIFAGIPCGMVAVAYADAVWALALGSTASAAWCGLAFVAAVAVWVGRGAVTPAFNEARRHIAELTVNPRGLVGLGAVAIATALLIALHLHTMDIRRPTWMFGGSPFSDLPFHLAVTSTLAHNSAAPARHPYCGSAPLQYHYMVDEFSAALIKLGARIDRSIQWPDALSSICVFGLLVLLAHRCGLQRRGVVFAVLLAALGGGTGVFDYLAIHLKQGNLSATEFFLSNPMDIWPAQNLYWSNLVRDILLHTRTTGPALCLAMTAWLLILRDEPRRCDLALAGLCVSLLPLVNMHVFVGAAGVLAVCFLWTKGRGAGWFIAGLLPLSALSLLPLVLHPPALKNTPHVTWGWMNVGPNVLVFWLRNLGAVLLLAACGSRWLSSEGRRLLLGGAAVFLLGNLVILTSMWANEKMMLCGFLIACVSAGAALDALWRSGRPGAAIAVCMLVLSCASGAQSLVYTLSCEHSVLYPPQAEVAAWLSAHGRDNSVVACGDDDSLTVCAAGGRFAFAVYPNLLVDHGIHGDDRIALRDKILIGAPRALRSAAREGVDYALIRRTNAFDDAGIDEVFSGLGWRKVLQNNALTLYQRSP